MRTRIPLLVLLAVLPVAAHAGKPTALPARPAAAPGRIDLSLNRVPVADALQRVLSTLPGKSSYVVRGELPDTRVTVRLTNVDVDTALRTICQAAGLQYAVETARGRPVIVISPTPETMAALHRRRESTGLPEPAEFRAWPQFQGDGRLVDLQVEGVSLEEAAAQLAQSSGYEITVDPAVPKGIEVTATVRQMPIGDVLTQLTGQAHLAYSVSYRPSRREVEAWRRTVDEAREELGAAKRRVLEAEAEAKAILAAVTKNMEVARHAVEGTQEEAQIAKARVESGVGTHEELAAKQRAFADAQTELAHAQQVVADDRQRQEDHLLTGSQVEADAALARAERKLEQVRSDVEAAAEDAKTGRKVTPDALPIIHIVPIPELRVTLP